MFDCIDTNNDALISGKELLRDGGDCAPLPVVRELSDSKRILLQVQGIPHPVWILLGLSGGDRAPLPVVRAPMEASRHTPAVPLRTGITANTTD